MSVLGMSCLDYDRCGCVVCVVLANKGLSTQRLLKQFIMSRQCCSKSRLFKCSVKYYSHDCLMWWWETAQKLMSIHSLRRKRNLFNSHNLTFLSFFIRQYDKFTTYLHQLTSTFLSAYSAFHIDAYLPVKTQLCTGYLMCLHGFCYNLWYS